MATSSIVTYHKMNPDPLFSVCRNTGFIEDGVNFDGIEPMEGVFTFVGRTSLIEAIGLLYDLDPKQVVESLEGGNKALRVKIGRLEDERNHLADRLAKVQSYVIDGVIRETGDNEPLVS